MVPYLTSTRSIILSYGKFLNHDYPSSMNVPELGSPIVRLFIRLIIISDRFSVPLLIMTHAAPSFPFFPL